MAVASESCASSTPPITADDVTECCFLLNNSNKEKSLPREFLTLLKLHRRCLISIIQGPKTWEIEVYKGSFRTGWAEFASDNLIRLRGKILIRHNGDLRFDLILFTDLQMNTFFPWTVPLVDVLQVHNPYGNDAKAKYILYQRVCTAIKPNIVQNQTDSIAFFQIYSRKNMNSMKIPKFVRHFLNCEKHSLITLRTGYNAFRIGLQDNRLTHNWEVFVEAHQLEIGETLVFIPESIDDFTVQVYRTDGVEKIFPWYHKYYVYSYL